MKMVGHAADDAADSKDQPRVQGEARYQCTYPVQSWMTAAGPSGHGIPSRDSCSLAAGLAGDPTASFPLCCCEPAWVWG